MAAPTKKPALPETLPTSDLTGQQLRWGYWLATHRLQVHRAGVAVLVALNLVIWLPGLYQWIRLWQEPPLVQVVHQELAAALARPVDLTRTAALPLQVGSVIALVGTGQTAATAQTDLVVEVANQNQDWYAPQVQYRFLAGATALASGQTAFRPGEVRHLAVLGLTVQGLASGAQLELSGVEWRRLDPRQPLPELAWEVSDVRFTPGSGAASPAQASAAIRNGSAYSFWQVDLLALAYQGKRLVAAANLPLRDFEAQSVRPAVVSFPSLPSGVTGVLFEPQVNVFDPSAFKPLRAPN